VRRLTVIVDTVESFGFAGITFQGFLQNDTLEGA